MILWLIEGAGEEKPCCMCTGDPAGVVIYLSRPRKPEHDEIRSK